MQIAEIIEKQRDYFASGKTLDASARVAALKALQAAIRKNEQGVLDAVKSDLNKTPFEAYATELGMVMAEISHAIGHVRAWMRPKAVPTPMMHFSSSSRIVKEPYGVVLIMSPWNYPFQLTLAPLIGSIAAGNCTVVKPSAYSPATSQIIAKIMAEAFDPGFVSVVQGGREANKTLLEHKFDYILFTGSVEVGKTVMESASKYLTPVTLELGGKSPVIVAKDADINMAAKRIIWGKTLNSGQTCVAPDYVYVHRDVKDALLEAMQKHAKAFFGEHSSHNDTFPRMVNAKHFERVKAFFSNGKLVFGGESESDKLRLDLTILDSITWDDPVMGEEIFGPVLPILTFTDLRDVITTVNGRPKPLALYLFTSSSAVEKEVLSRVSFGGGCVNDTIVHLASSHMPFGGVGNSGMGGYHGKWSYDTFSHAKSILKKATAIDVPVRYPPYDKGYGLLKKLMG